MAPRKLIAGAVLLLASCADTNVIEAKAAFQSLHGQSISKLTAKLGPPNSEQRVGSEHWFTWDYQALEYFGTAGYAQMQCRFSARINEHNIVEDTRTLGNTGGCIKLAARLR